MANFKTHIASSGLLGTAYGAAGFVGYDMPLATSILSGGLVTIAGVLPDVDSDNGIILRESLALVAAVAPMLMLHRFREWGWTNETIVVVAGLTYVMVRFGLGTLLRRYTVHRGMWHSIPAAAIAGLIVYLLCSCPDERLRLFKTGAIITGYLWHLILDEIYSVETTSMGRVRIKRSFGTAMKFYRSSAWANISTYAKLILLSVAIFVDESPTLHDVHYTDAPAHSEPAHQSTPEEFPSAGPTYVPPYRY